jgi:hypothetical protein
MNWAWHPKRHSRSWGTSGGIRGSVTANSVTFSSITTGPHPDYIFDNILDIQPNQQFCEVQLARHRLAMCKAE